MLLGAVAQATCMTPNESVEELARDAEYSFAGVVRWESEEIHWFTLYRWSIVEVERVWGKPVPRWVLVRGGFSPCWSGSVIGARYFFPSGGDEWYFSPGTGVQLLAADPPNGRPPSWPMSMRIAFGGVLTGVGVLIWHWRRRHRARA